MSHISAILLSYLFFNPLLARSQPETTHYQGDTMVPFRQQLWVIGESQLQASCQQVQQDHRRIYYLFNRQARMSFRLKGIYTRQGLLFFRLSVANRSHLDYTIEGIRFFIWDRKDSKRLYPPALIPPIYNYGNVSLVKGKDEEESVVVLPQFTLPPDKWLMIEMAEKFGGRRLRLMVSNYSLLRSRPI